MCHIFGNSYWHAMCLKIIFVKQQSRQMTHRDIRHLSNVCDTGVRWGGTGEELLPRRQWRWTFLSGENINPTRASLYNILHSWNFMSLSHRSENVNVSYSFQKKAAKTQTNGQRDSAPWYLLGIVSLGSITCGDGR